MSENQFDVVVVGAGAAGVCCAGELHSQGAKVALVSEAPEVGWNLRPTIVEGNAGFCQLPVWQAAWGGGWWYPLARKLNVPVKFSIAQAPELFMRGAGWDGPRSLGMNVGTAGIIDLFAQMAPIPIDPMRDEFERIIGEAINMDWQQLLAMSNVPLSDWLAERNASVPLQLMLYSLCANLIVMPVEMAQDHASVFGLFGLLRVWTCAEGLATAIQPDGQNGLLVPMARIIEQQGTTITRGIKADQIIVESDRAVGVALRDGTEIRAKAVAIATGTRRIATLLPVVPDSVKTVLDYSAQLESRDACVYTVLDRPVVTFKEFTCVATPAGESEAFLYPMHSLAPWTTLPGKQFLITQHVRPVKDFEAAGGLEGVAAELQKINEDLFPGFAEATSAVKIGNHSGLAMEQLTAGPKLHRKSDDIAGLWFVGDGAAPSTGVGVEAAAGSGIVGARQLLGELRSSS